MTSTYARDRTTWLAYLVLLHYSYFFVSLGAVLPYLRRELDMGYSVGSVHLSAFAGGVLLSALAARRVERARGRTLLVGVGLLGLSGAALGITLGHVVWLTLACALGMGAFGGWSLVGAQAALADGHPEHRAVALSEANVAASLGAMVLPLAVGAAQAVVGWRAALVAGAALGVVLAVALRRVGVHPAAVQTRAEEGVRPPRRVWLALAALFALLCTEGCLSFWGASFIDDVVGLSTSTAVACTSAFFGAMLTGRLIASALARRIGAAPLLGAAIALAALAFPLLWTATGALSAIAGLVLVGLGVGAFWPLSVAVAISAHPAGAGVVSARTVMAGAAAGIVSPLVLGPIGDAAGLTTAFAVVPAALVVAAASLAAFYRREQRAAEPTPVRSS
jgi:MFS family permease